MAVLDAFTPVRRVNGEPVMGPMFAEGGPLAAQQRQRRTLTAWRAAHPLAIHVARHLLVALIGFGCLVAAAFQWHLWAGLVSTGLSVLAVEVMVENATEKTLAKRGGNQT
jgi:hypothetical protein